MIVMVMALGLGFAAVLYWMDRGHGLAIPVPQGLDLPAAR